MNVCRRISTSFYNVPIFQRYSFKSGFYCQTNLEQKKIFILRFLHKFFFYNINWEKEIFCYNIYQMNYISTPSLQMFVKSVLLFVKKKKKNWRSIHQILKQTSPGIYIPMHKYSFILWILHHQVDLNNG